MVTLKNPLTGVVVKAPTGFSWTTLFFGFFVPLLRGNYGYAGICLICSMFTFGISNLVFSFLINKHHIKHLLTKGYKPDTTEDTSCLVSLDIGYSEGSSPIKIKEAA